MLGIESPHGTIMYGLRREVLLGQAEEPEAMLAGLDAVTAEDVQRVAQDIVTDLKLAVIGPFEDPERSRASRARLTERLPSTADERALLARAAEIAVGYLDTLDARPVRPEADYGAMLAGDRPSRARGPGSSRWPSSRNSPACAEPGLTAMGSGRYFGFVIGGTLPRRSGPTGSSRRGTRTRASRG